MKVVFILVLSFFTLNFGSFFEVQLLQGKYVMNGTDTTHFNQGRKTVLPVKFELPVYNKGDGVNIYLYPKATFFDFVTLLAALSELNVQDVSIFNASRKKLFKLPWESGYNMKRDTIHLTVMSDFESFSIHTRQGHSGKYTLGRGSLFPPLDSLYGENPEMQFTPLTVSFSRNGFMSDLLRHYRMLFKIHKGPFLFGAFLKNDCIFKRVPFSGKTYPEKVKKFYQNNFVQNSLIKALTILTDGCSNPEAIRLDQGMSKNRSREFILNIIQEYQPEFRRTYKRHLKRNSGLGEKSTYKLWIDNFGNVDSLEIISSMFSDDIFQKEITNKLKSIKFGATREKNRTHFTFPLDFSK